MIGPMTPGTGWLPRADERYSTPISMDEFHRLNRKYVDEKIQTAKPSTHWQVMLNELLDDRAKGRVPRVCGMEPSPAPTSQAWAAVCFAVEQSDKVRRCEDYRRSSHNSTIYADDCPHYDDVERYVNTMRHLQHLGHGLPMIWGHDLTGAYRQIPLQPGDSSYTLLILPDGPSLWRHRAAPFGATASVWAFCRFSDSLLSVARRLLVTLAGHFVDDFTGVELPAAALSSCRCFKEFFQKLGLAMKPEKEQPPAWEQKLLGVIIHAEEDYLTVKTCPKRRDKLLQMLDNILTEERLSSDEAQRVAGKLGFFATSLYGGIGHAAIQPFFARAHNLGPQTNEKLTFALRAAIHILKQLLSPGPFHGKLPRLHLRQ
eukprot:s601_g16.t1